MTAAARVSARLTLAPLARAVLVVLAVLFPGARAGAESEPPRRPDPKAPAGAELAVPEGWQVLLDRPDDSMVVGAEPSADVFFVNMTPGWHATTGPAALFWHPGSTAEGLYRVELVVHLFDPKGGNEGYGLFVGGRQVEGGERAWDALLVRNSGEYRLLGTEGRFVEVLRDWTADPAILRFPPESAGNEEASVQNVLAVEVDLESVYFEINGARVAQLSREEINTDGVVGFRLGEGVNLHVSDLKVFKKTAP